MNELIHQIEDAFSNVPYPGDHNLTSASSYGDEPPAVIRDFAGKTDWRILDASFLDQAPEGWSTATSFLSDAAFQFYLPAYLIADIKGQLDTASPVSRLCSSLTPQGDGQRIAKVWGGGTMGERARAEFDEYDEKQVAAIVAYLFWKLESDGSDLVIELALGNYWLDRMYSDKPESNP